MKKISLILLGLYLGIHSPSFAQQCDFDTLRTRPPWSPVFAYICHEDPIDTVYYGDPHFSFPGPYNLGAYLSTGAAVEGGIHYSTIICIYPCPITPENTTLYGVAMAGGFSSKDLDSLRLVMVACTLDVNNQMTIIDSMDFSNYYIVRAFQHITTEDGKANVNYPYLYEFYFNQPHTITSDSVYLGFSRLIDNRHQNYLPSQLPFYVRTPYVYVTDANWGGPTFNWTWVYNPLTEQWSRGHGAAWAGFFAITSPDNPRCAAPPSPRIEKVSKGQVRISWDSTAYDSVQLSFVEVDTLGQPVSTPTVITLPASDTSTTISALNPAYYAARLRTTCLHVCPNHDTIVWADWSNATLISLIDSTAPSDTDSVGISSLDIEKQNFEVHPNPTTGLLTITLPDTHLGATLQLLDLDGKLLREFKPRNSKFELDLSAFPAGAYLLRVGSRTLRVMKN